MTEKEIHLVQQKKKKRKEKKNDDATVSFKKLSQIKIVKFRKDMLPVHSSERQEEDRRTKQNTGWCTLY